MSLYCNIIKEPHKYLSIKSYKVILNKKVINLINFGEIHSIAPKLNFDIFKNYKTCFYSENILRLFNKNITDAYFVKITSKESKQRRINLVGKEIYCDFGYDNFYNLRLNFSYYYKKNNYKFSNKNDKEVIKNSKPYNKLWDYCPCDLRKNIFCKYFLCLTYLIKYYIIINHDIYKADYYKKLFKKHFKNYNFQIELPKTFKKFKQHYIEQQSKITNDYPEENDEIYLKIYKILKKYFNEDYFNIVKNKNNKNVKRYFSKFNITDMIIDLFNVYTYFYYEKDLQLFPIIYQFIDYLFKVNYKSNLMFIKSYYWLIIPIYDIVLYINLLKNLQKYDYHVIYNGSNHTRLFDIFILFLQTYTQLKII